MEKANGHSGAEHCWLAERLAGRCCSTTVRQVGRNRGLKTNGCNVMEGALAHSMRTGPASLALTVTSTIGSFVTPRCRPILANPHAAPDG